MTEHANKWYKENQISKKAYANTAYTIGNEKLREIKRVECYDCKGRFPAYVMHFDHVRGKKLFNITKAQTRKWKSVLDEISKCDIVCGNCHAIRTHTRWCKDEVCTHI